MSEAIVRIMLPSGLLCGTGGLQDDIKRKLVGKGLEWRIPAPAAAP